MQDRQAETGQKPLQLILARNLLTSLSTPAFLLGKSGELLFYNEAAGAMLGVSFEDAGRMMPEQWISRFGPYDEEGKPVPLDELELTLAIRDSRPGHSTFSIRGNDGALHEIAASALPIVSAEHGSTGAIVIFWPVDEEVAKTIATPIGTEVTG